MGFDYKVVFGCVAENNPKYLAQALRLIQSVRWFGGSLSQVDFIVCVVDNVDPDYRIEFEKHHAQVRIVSRFSEKHPPSNKLRYLELPDIDPYDIVVLLDCDTIIVQDPSGYLKNDRFQARIVNSPSIPHHIFEKLFAHFGIDLPSQRFGCLVRHDQIIPYFNAGVLIFPREIIKKLVPTWIQLNRQLIADLTLLEGRDFYCEQASLCLAVAKNSIEFDFLDVAMNFPVQIKEIEECFVKSLEKVDPIIIHYHWWVDDFGYLKTSIFSTANLRIALFNQKLKMQQGKVISEF